MIKRIALFISVSISILLSACSSMNSGFDCPNQAGVMCKSVDQINSMVESGQIKGRSELVSGDEKTNEKINKKINTKMNKKTPSIEFQPYLKMSEYYPGAPIRYGETIQRIWITPYEDTEHNYHQDSFIYFIVKKGHWVSGPVKTV